MQRNTITDDGTTMFMRMLFAAQTVIFSASLAISPSSLANAGLILPPLDDDQGQHIEKALSPFDEILLNAAWSDQLDITPSALLDGARVYSHRIEATSDGAVMFDFH
jgi:hypothetical protein